MVVVLIISEPEIVVINNNHNNNNIRNCTDVDGPPTDNNNLMCMGLLWVGGGLPIEGAVKILWL